MKNLKDNLINKKKKEEEKKQLVSKKIIYDDINHLNELLKEIISSIKKMVTKISKKFPCT